MHVQGYAHKSKVFSQVDRNTEQARSIVVDDLKLKTLLPIIQANVSPKASVLTDEAGQYKHLKMHFRDQGFVSHGLGEYVSRDDVSLHTNKIEVFFSIFKRCMKGVYQHCGHNHLNRYLAEFDFR
jgi:transposase-like protein